MSDNGDERVPAWLVWIIGLTGIGMAISGVGFGLVEQRRYVEEANQAASEYARHTADKANESCSICTVREKHECLANAKHEYELKRSDKRREYDDLVAQQQSALWTGVMGVAAVAGMILSVAGIYLVYATFRET